MNLRSGISWLTLMTVCGAALAQETPGQQKPPQEGPKALSGMSVLGNNEAPKSLVIVPWKSSEIGSGMDVLRSLNNRPVPVDRDVFKRELRYYTLRTKQSKSVQKRIPDLEVAER